MVVKSYMVSLTVCLFVINGYFYLGVNCLKPSKGSDTKAPDVKNGEVKQLFDLSLVQNLNKAGQSDKSWLVSPVSVRSVLEIIYSGTSSQTKDELASILHVNKDQDVTSRQAKLNEKPKDGVVWNSSNRILVRNSFKLKDSYKSQISSVFHGQVDSVDFTKPQQVVDQVNTWIAKSTNQLITHLVDASDLSPESLIVLLNAVYFKGTWKYNFEEKLTRKECFQQKAKSCIDVDMMKQKNQDLKFGQHEGLGAKILQLPYSDERYSMVVVLPDETEGLGKLIAKIDQQQLLDFVTSMQTGNVDLTLPKFQTKFKLNLNQPLQQMGLKSIFSADGDFSSMSDNKGIFISDVIHEAHISVSEKGTEAAASTGAVMSRSLIVDEPKFQEFRADHPFLYLILYDREILFAGQYRA